MKKRMLALSFLALAGILLVAGCTGAITKIGTSIAADKGLITEEQKGAIDRSEEAFRKRFEELTEEEEYYIGRAVAATILSRYELYENKSLTKYVNRVGRSVAIASSRPEIYNGYHFAVLDVDDVNAFATPGGFIFVTRGMLAQVPDEESLAAVLAHEVGHVAKKHGLGAIKKSRLIDAFSVLGKEAGTAWNKEELLKVTDAFDGAVGDIVRTLIEKGYSRSQEEDADRVAVAFATGIGYQADGLSRFLDQLEQSNSGSRKLGMLKTHPGAGARKKAVARAVTEHSGSGTDPAPRKARFEQAMASL